MTGIGAKQLRIFIVLICFLLVSVVVSCSTENLPDTITKTLPVTTTVTVVDTQTSTVSTTDTITTSSTSTKSISITETITVTTTKTENITITSTPSKGIIRDSNLEVAVRAALGKQSGEILMSELASLNILHATNMGITDLTGIGYCTNLIELDLSNNQISDIYPLSNLINLEVLNLDTNWIVDISAVSRLTNINWLNIQGNDIGNIWPLAYNTGLGEGDRVFLPKELIVVEHTGPWDVLDELENRGVILNIQYNW
jgi:Leucine-rich repeat (LRR) protein